LKKKLGLQRGGERKKKEGVSMRGEGRVTRLRFSTVPRRTKARGCPLTSQIRNSIKVVGGRMTEEKVVMGPHRIRSDRCLSSGPREE